MKYTIAGAVIIAAAVGFWQRDAIGEAWRTRGMTDDQKSQWRLEQELEAEGAINAEGEFELDAEFDDELNGIDDELDREDASGSDDLDDLETQE